MTTKRNSLDRFGFTLIELLVSVAIVALLASLVMPAVIRAQASAKRIACLANLRTIGQSIASYATENNGITIPVSKGVNATQGNWKEVLTEWDGTKKSLATNENLKGTFGHWRCPENREQIYAIGSGSGLKECSYSINGALGPPESYPAGFENGYCNNYLSRMSSPSKLYTVWDGAWYANWAQDVDGQGAIPVDLYRGKGIRNVRYAHSGKINMLFADGHCETLLGPLEGPGTWKGGDWNQASSWSNGEHWYAN